MLRRLRDLQQQSIEKSRTVTPAVKCKLERPFANIGSDHGKSTARGGDEEMFIKHQKTDASSSCLAPLGTMKPTAIGPHDGATSPVARNSLLKSHRLPSEHWFTIYLSLIIVLFFYMGMQRNVLNHVHLCVFCFLWKYI